MNFTASSYTGARAVTFTASGSSSIIKAGSQATLDAVAVHVGLKGDTGAAGGNIVAIAETALSGHIAVTLNDAGNAIAADNSVADHGGAVVGITTGSALQGASVSILAGGSIEHLGWTFTPNQPIYLGASGQLTQTPPIGAFVKVLGVARTSTRINISIQPAIYFN